MKFKILKCFIMTISTYGFAISTEETMGLKDLPAPYYALSKVLPFDPHHWYSDSNRSAMVKFFENKIDQVLEVGSCLDGATRQLGLIPEGGKLYDVDTWEGSSEHHDQTRTDIFQELPTLYNQFLSNVVHAYLTDKIISCRMTSLEAS